MSEDWRNKRMAIVKRSKEGQPYKVGHIWPWTKTLPDGTSVIKELPPQYRMKNGKYPDFIKEVPDEVQPGWVWDGETFSPPVKKPVVPLPEPHSDLLEVVAEKIGVPYDDLFAEVMARKKARVAKLKGLTPPDQDR